MRSLQKFTSVATKGNEQILQRLKNLLALAADAGVTGTTALTNAQSFVTGGNTQNTYAAASGQPMANKHNTVQADASGWHR